MIIEQYPKFPRIVLPTEQQQLLLKALFASQDNFLPAWQKWNDLIDLENLDEESNRFLGLLYQRVSTYGVKTPYQDKLKGIYRYNWTKNQIKLRELKKVFEVFKKLKIEVIWYGDLALIAYFYQDYGSRNISSSSLFVAPQDYLKVQEMMGQLGWQIQKDLESSSVFQKDSDFWLYLNTRIFWAEPQDFTDEQLRRYAISIEFDTIQFRILSSTDRFLYLCALSHRDRQYPLIHWLVDSTIILNSPDLDWSRLVTQAKHYQLILPLRNMLNFLNSLVGISLPSWVLYSLSRMPISDYELKTYYVLPSQNF